MRSLRRRVEVLEKETLGDDRVPCVVGVITFNGQKHYLEPTPNKFGKVLFVIPENGSVLTPRRKPKTLNNDEWNEYVALQGGYTPSWELLESNIFT